MAFDKKPQTWLGAAYRLSGVVTVPATSQASNKIRIAGTVAALFLQDDDPIAFDISFNSVVANTVYYIDNLTTTGGNTEFTVTNVPSWGTTPTTITIGSGSSPNVKIPNRISLLLTDATYPTLPTAVTLTAALANRLTGDIRNVYDSLLAYLGARWTAISPSNRPTRVRYETHNFTADVSLATVHHTLEFDHSVTAGDLATEP